MNLPRVGPLTFSHLVVLPTHRKKHTSQCYPRQGVVPGESLSERKTSPSGERRKSQKKKKKKIKPLTTFCIIRIIDRNKQDGSSVF